MVADHLSRLIEQKVEELPLDGSSLDDRLFLLVQKETPWYDDFINYFNTRVWPPDMSY